MAELHNLTDTREVLNIGRAVIDADNMATGWTGLTANQLAESLDELSEEDGEFADKASQKFSGFMTLVEEGGLEPPAPAEGKEAKDPSLMPIMVDDTGNLKAVKLPRICASENGQDVVLVVGDYVGICKVSGKSITVGDLKGDIESQRKENQDKSKTWYSFECTLKSKDSGDRFVVTVRSKRDLDKAGFDDACDEGNLVSVLDTNSSGGFTKALNMATLEVTKKGEPGYPVLEVRKVSINKEGEKARSFNVLVVEKDGAPVEVSSRSSIDALLNSGFDVARIRAAGKGVELRIYAKNPMPGREGVFEVEATLKKVAGPAALKAATSSGNRARRLSAKVEKEAELAMPGF